MGLRNRLLIRSIFVDGWDRDGLVVRPDVDLPPLLGRQIDQLDRDGEPDLEDEVVDVDVGLGRHASGGDRLLHCGEEALEQLGFRVLLRLPAAEGSVDPDDERCRVLVREVAKHQRHVFEVSRVFSVGHRELLSEPESRVDSLRANPTRILSRLY